MTTIAWDLRHGTIAGDGLVCAGNDIITRSAQKIIVQNKAIYALSGTGAFHIPLIWWIEKGADPKSMPEAKGDVSWRLIVIREFDDGSRRHIGVVGYDDAFPYPFDLPDLDAIGSGADLAIGAMRSNRTPREAVEIAMLHNIKTGGDIQVVDIAEALQLPNSISPHIVGEARLKLA
jgi:ATP-dependent protease HslVU (ClpYQ) peptidase subunit